MNLSFLSRVAKNFYESKTVSHQTIGSSGIDLRTFSIKLLKENKQICLKSDENKFTIGDYKSILDKDSQLISTIQDYFILKPNQRCLATTSIAVAIEENLEIQIRPRSGLAIKNGITVLNTPGTVDSDYRGEIAVILMNTSDEDFKIYFGDRIAQMVLCPIVKQNWNIQEYESLDISDRSTKGFGSTGLK